VEKYAVILEGQLKQATGLPDLADAVMEALLDSGAEDPFVFTDGSIPSLHVEVVMEASTQTDALARGVQQISEALTAAGVSAPVLTPSARAMDLAAG
jgi:hypothetical protein